jgi:hypothetical protein
MPSALNACVIFAIVSEICTKCDALSLSVPSRNHVRPDTRLKITGHTNQHFSPVAWNFLLWLQSNASTITYRCSKLLQLLYRW